MRYGHLKHTKHQLKPLFFMVPWFFGIALNPQSFASTPLTDNELEQNYISIQSSTIKPSKPSNCYEKEKLKLKESQIASRCSSNDDSYALTTSENEKNKEDRENAESKLGLAPNSLSQQNGLSQLLATDALQKAQQDLTKKNKEEVLNSLNQDPLKNTLGQVQVNPDGTLSLTSTEPGVIEFGYIYKSVNSETDIEIPSIKVGYTQFKIQTNK